MGRILFKLLSLYAIGAVLSDPTLEPLNADVLLGSEARFNVSLSQSWVSMTWLLKDVVVLTISSKYGVLRNEPRYTAANFSTTGAHRWGFFIQNVTRNDSGPISCAIQNLNPLTAQLSVHVKGSLIIAGGNVTIPEGHQAIFRCEAAGWFPEPTLNWTVNGALVDPNSKNTSSEDLNGLYNSTSLLTLRAANSGPVQCLASVPALTTPQSSIIYLVVVPQNWTVLIAVVCSIGGLALLVLLVLGIIYCCKRRKEANSKSDQEKMRQAASSVSGGVAAEQRQEYDNPAYVRDNNTRVTQNEFNDSGYSQSTVSNNFEIPDIININQAANGRVDASCTLDGTVVRKHRHATIV
ncbi:hypothetical protein DPEC_G00233230 [Dallia pectoralis]|uniref:Uncharacterized protein n=1 Tax=Dallia pectoralis TaxID=75939 RepID=A0ACC2FXJ2_DALPE|nr:hypothetical protein DPEC_G00233230 [Dallia pectoralis]